MASFEITVEKRFPLEGGFQNSPVDTANYCGGQLIGTNLGISAQGYASYYGSCPSVSQLQALTKDQAKQVYKAKYWDKINGDKVKNQSVAEIMFLYIIGNPSTVSDLKGIANLIKGQKVIVENDNAITDAEIKIINSLDQARFHAALKQWRIDFYHKIVANDPSKGIFLNGWLKGIEKYVYVPGNSTNKVLIFAIIGLAAIVLIFVLFKNVTNSLKVIFSLLIIGILFLIYKITK